MRFIALLLSLPLYAIDLPVLIDSDHGIKCEETGKKCTARGNVKVTKGSYVLFCDKLTALFRKGKKDLDVHHIHAYGNIRFKGPEGEKAFAQEATLDMDQKKLTLLTARRKQPIIIKGNHTIQAPQVEAYLLNDNKLKIVQAVQAPQKVVKKKQQIHALIYPSDFKKRKTDGQKKPKA